MPPGLHRSLSESLEFLDPAVKKKPETHTLEIDAIIAMLNQEWDLRIPLSRGNDSPRQRQEKGWNTEVQCLVRIKFLQYQDKDKLSKAKGLFDDEAQLLYQGWVHKPHQERGVLPPRTRHVTHPVSDMERKELLACLLRILDEPYQEYRFTPSSSRKREPRRMFDDTPIASPSLLRSVKRTSNDHFDDVSIKKQKQPTEQMAPPRTRRQTELHAETSFVSHASTVFSHAPSLKNFQTQSTLPDEESEIATEPNSPVHGPQSSDYGSSSFDQHVKDSSNAGHTFDDAKILLKEDDAPGLLSFEIAKSNRALKDLCASLQNLFPAPIAKVEHLPLVVLYEATRVAISTGVTIADLKLNECSSLSSYKKFWAYIRQLPCLHKKDIPTGCGEQVWTAALSDDLKSKLNVVYAGSLVYDMDKSTVKSSPIFKFRLEPLRMDKSHRLSRHLGNNRFFELDLPQLSGKTPSYLGQLGEAGQNALISWLVDGIHELFGRTWKPFHVKPKERRGRKWERSVGEEFDTGHRLYMFAVAGQGLTKSHEFRLNPGSNHQAYQEMSIGMLLDFIRPTHENRYEKYLKLFARTDLAVSRNTPALILERTQIIYESDIKVDGEVMTDGAGQISVACAKLLAENLSLTFIPSGFQARIGEAKGFWSVDCTDISGKVWIKVLKSQRKWECSVDPLRRDHEYYRTFEVLRYSSPLKPADINMQFLPLLRDRAIDPSAMVSSLKTLLKDGLEQDLSEQQNASTTPQGLRAWQVKKSPGTSERIKNESVTYRAGFPITMDERLILLLDAGFNPREQVMLSDLMLKAFKAECEDLKKRLNITVPKSTYAYMVPDFTGTLEKNEVFINFSQFSDKSSGLQNVRPVLNQVDLLVARSPAHFASDMQKVRAVFKIELMALVDVIVFSTKGNLAAKLSGGDYDGDIAWICWEPTIVNNFQNAEVPPTPDLVKEGLMQKINTTYIELVDGKPNPTSLYLNKSLQFNLQPSLLGICTRFKEEMCYTLQSISCPKAILMSAILSNLVDQAKQGFVFSFEQWKIVKDTRINMRPLKPGYRHQVSRKSKDITDQVSLAADMIVDAAKTKLYKRIGSTATGWDPDLVKPYEYAKTMADKEKLEGSPMLYTPLVTNLVSDLREWNQQKGFSFSGADDDANNGFLAKVDVLYQRLLEIMPHEDNTLARSLLPDHLSEEVTPWALLRASALYAMTPRNGQKPNYTLWNVAGRQLAKIKADYGGTGPAHSVVRGMYWFLRPDARMAKHTSSVQEVDDNLSVVNANELADLSD